MLYNFFDCVKIFSFFDTSRELAKSFFELI